jgi:hypothetical protein
VDKALDHSEATVDSRFRQEEKDESPSIVPSLTPAEESE